MRNAEAVLSGMEKVLDPPEKETLPVVVREERVVAPVTFKVEERVVAPVTESVPPTVRFPEESKVKGVPLPTVMPVGVITVEEVLSEF